MYRRDRDQLGFYDAVYDVTVPKNHLVRKGVLADKGYDSLMNFVYLALNGQRAGIIAKAIRGRKRGHIKNRYPGAKDHLWFCRHKKKRSLVERFFAETKQWHGLGRARYRGLDKTKVQVIWTALAYNLKRMVKLCPEPT